MGQELILIGIAGGVLGGLLGVGGGTIYIPFLVLLLHLPQQAAQGIALTVMIPVSLLGGYAYFKKGNTRKDIFIELMIGSTIGSVCGTLTALSIPGLLLQKIFSVILLIIRFKMILERK